MTACVRLEGVTKTFGSVRAVLGVTLEVPAAQVTVVEGPNGSGKSTLLGVLGLLVRPTLGTVDHSHLGREPGEVRGRIGWVGHDSLCYGDLSGRENVELAARLHGKEPGAAYARARERFDLGAFAERPVRTYSRGQRQRVAIARALVHAPALLLLDEPSEGLDSESRGRLANVIREEAQRGAAVVVVTHDPELAGAGARYRMERGRLEPYRSVDVVPRGFT